MSTYRDELDTIPDEDTDPDTLIIPLSARVPEDLLIWVTDESGDHLERVDVL